MLLARSAASRHAPTSPEYAFVPVLLLERLQLPIPIDEAVCSGCRPAGPVGTPYNGMKRPSPTEHMLARVCQEASAKVKFNAFLRDMNVNVAATDERSRRPELAVVWGRPVGGRHHSAMCAVQCRAPQHRLGNLTLTPLTWVAHRSWLLVKTKSELTPS